MISILVITAALIIFLELHRRQKVTPPLLFIIIVALCSLLIAAQGLYFIRDHFTYQTTICKIEKQTPVDTPTYKTDGGVTSVLYCPEVLISYEANHQTYQKIIEMGCGSSSNKENQILNFVKFSEFPCSYIPSNPDDIKISALGDISDMWYLTTALYSFIFIFAIYVYVVAREVRFISISKSK